MTDWPKVTIIVLNYNGLIHLSECFSSLVNVNYPADKLTLMMMDNASSDGSVNYIKANYPQVEIIINDDNLGFSPGNNKGTHVAKSKYVIFLNNDMYVDPQFVQELVKGVYNNTDVVCAGAKILNWDGSLIDFAGSGIDFAGHGYQFKYGEPIESDKATKIEETLFACGGAMIIDRKVFLDVGGFDEDYFIYYEDVDLGWRLWVLGYKVVFAPQAIVYHRHHGTMDSFSNYRKCVLYKRNSLYTILKNYSEENMYRVLSTVLLSSTEGIVNETVKSEQLDLEDFYIKSLKKPSNTPIQIDKVSSATLVAIHEVVKNFPELMKKRRLIQENRKRTDKEVAEKFRCPFSSWPDADLRTQYPIATAFQVQQVFKHLSRKVLIISSDILPYPGVPNPESDLRAWWIGQGLLSKGHEIVFSIPNDKLNSKYQQYIPSEVKQFSWKSDSIANTVNIVRPDIIVVCHWSLLDIMDSTIFSIPIILDLSDYNQSASQLKNVDNIKNDASKIINSLRKADFVIFSSSKQQSIYSNLLSEAGWAEQEQLEFSAMITYSLSSEISEQDLVEKWSDKISPLDHFIRSPTVRYRFSDKRNKIYEPAVKSPNLVDSKQNNAKNKIRKCLEYFKRLVRAGI